MVGYTDAEAYNIIYEVMGIDETIAFVESEEETERLLAVVDNAVWIKPYCLR